MLNWYAAEEIARERGEALNQPLSAAERDRLEMVAEEASARGSLRERIAKFAGGIRFGADAFYEEYDVVNPREDILMEARLSAYLR